MFFRCRVLVRWPVWDSGKLDSCLTRLNLKLIASQKSEEKGEHVLEIGSPSPVDLPLLSRQLSKLDDNNLVVVHTHGGIPPHSIHI